MNASADSGAETGDPSPGDTAAAPCDTVSFLDEQGSLTDLTAALQSGEEVVLDQGGRLEVCPGTWFSLVTVRAPVAVVGLGATREETVLSGGDAGSVLVAEGPSASLTVERIALERGAARGERNAASGGGLRCTDGATVTLTDVVVRDNFAYDGGGLYAGEGCALTVERALLAGNTSSDDGGALRLDNAVATLRDVTVTGSRAKDGGAVIAWQSQMSIQGGLFSDNQSTDSQGGAILHYFGDLEVDGTTFRRNRSLEVGGALSSFGPARLSNVRLEGNESGSGGAVFVYTDEGSLSCTACRFARNGPDDIALDGGESYRFEDETDLICDAGGCR